METQNNIIDKSAHVFRDVRLVNCNVGPLCTIGDYCDVVNTDMQKRSELGRRNVVRHAYLDKGTYTGMNTFISGAKIGKYCCISWNVSIGGGSHNYHHISMYNDYWFNRMFGVVPPDIDDISQRYCGDYQTHIGSDVWIGAGAQIMAGVTIGDGCVIGAGAIVLKDVPPYSIVVGCPAKVIKKRFDDNIIEILLKLQWWNWSEDKIRENILMLRNEPQMNKLLLLEEI